MTTHPHPRKSSFFPYIHHNSLLVRKFRFNYLVDIHGPMSKFARSSKIAKNWRNRSFLLKLSQVVKEIEGFPAKTRLAIFRNKRKIAIFAAACKPGHKCMARFSWIRVKVKQGNVKLCHEP